MLLEEDHMEDIVDLCARWELQLISHIADAFKHQVGPVLSWGQLAGGPVSDAGGGTVMKAQPSPIANLQNDIAMTLVVVLLHSRLSARIRSRISCKKTSRSLSCLSRAVTRAMPGW